MKLYEKCKSINAAAIIKSKMKEKNITIYKLSEATGIRYELLRRSINGKRKLLADEYLALIEILEK